MSSGSIESFFDPQTSAATHVLSCHRRDRTLAMPARMPPSVQVSARAGHLPPAEDNGARYLKLPLNAL